MKLMFIGADHEVTGSCHYLEANGRHILVDYGMEQGANVFENAPLPVEEARIDYVFLTHAHVDHSGLLPLLFAKGFRGKIFATDASADLCSIMLRDCAHIQMMETEWKNRKAKRSVDGRLQEPLFNMEDADGAIKCIAPCRYGEMIDVCEGISIRFTDIGHLLGSASIEVWLTEEGRTRKLVFSGDIGNKNQPLIKDPSLTKEADYVIMESTYGDRLHPQDRLDYVTELAGILQETFDRGGNVVIPSFAVGRTQEMLYFLRKIKVGRLVKGHEGFPVYVDSPLAVEATHVFKENMTSCYDEETKELVEQGINPISFPGLKLSVTSEESKNINFDSKPKVIISASGMCDAGRIRHHLKHNLWRKECAVVFAGYQAEGTLGRILQDGNPTVKLFGESIDVEARIEEMHDISGHADQKGLLEWIGAFEKKPQQVFVVHGNDAVCDRFADLVTEQIGIPAKAPYSGAIYDLKEGCWLRETAGIPIAPKMTESAKKAAGVFARLLAAGERLMGVIARNEGGANKDLARFADQVNNLCDKWDR